MNRDCTDGSDEAQCSKYYFFFIIHFCLLSAHILGNKWSGLAYTCVYESKALWES